MLDNCKQDGDRTLWTSSTSRPGSSVVVPFLSQHIPQQYNPQGVPQSPTTTTTTTARRKDPNTKFCYRHQPDSKCRRTADEPTMENLQTQLETLSRSDQQGISHVWSLFSAAPAKHRTLMLQGILAQCCFPQLSYLSAQVKELIKIDFITALPNEVSTRILCFLDAASLCRAAQVSRDWNSLAEDDVVWHKMCEQHVDRKCAKCGWGLPLLEKKRLREWKRQQQQRTLTNGRQSNSFSPDLPSIIHDHHDSTTMVRSSSLNGATKRDAATFASDGQPTKSSDRSKRQCTSAVNGDASASAELATRKWKQVYRDRHLVSTNWKYGRCRFKAFRGHTNGIMCLQFDDNILASGSYDCSIKIWSLETGECLRTLRGHQDCVRTLQFDDNKLISGSADHTIKLWNWKTGECMKTWEGHTYKVLSVHFDGNLLASGSADKTVRIWNFETGTRQVFRGHTDWVNAVRLHRESGTLFSASDDLTVRLWDLTTGTTIQTFAGHVAPVQQIVMLPDYKPEDPDNEDEVSTPSDYSRSPSPPPDFANWAVNRPNLPPKYILTSALDATIRLWDVESGRCLKQFFGHVEGIWSLAADALRIVSGAQDHMVKIWDARTGTCEKTFSGVHEGPVTCIGLSDSRLCTGSEDGVVKLWSFEGPEGA
ncbi:sulfur controller-2 [Bisporella sp. PMI_857]|nr:sulfur controller-2 [Bisporella sp. PMI_857]